MRGTLAVRLLAMILAGFSLGMITAARLTGDEHGLFAIRNGPWSAWPDAAGPDSDPYSRSHFLGAGRLPVNGFEALEFTATRDSDGRGIDGGCTYRIAGEAPAVRQWELAVFPRGATGSTPPAARLVSDAAIYEPDGRLTIALSSEAQPGNWLAVPDRSLILRFTLDASLAQLRDPAKLPLPAIIRGDCS